MLFLKLAVAFLSFCSSFSADGELVALVTRESGREGDASFSPSLSLTPEC